MEEYRSNEIKVGLFVLTGFIVLVLFLLAIFGVDFGADSKEYYTHLNYVGGIKEGSLVKFGGMDVGLVTEIVLPNATQKQLGLKLRIDERTPVRMDSDAYITSIGIMMAQHIEITAGSLDAALLPAGSELRGKEVLSFMQMAEPFAEINEQVSALLGRLTDVFDDENRDRVKTMLANMDKILDEGGDKFLTLVDNLEGMTESLASISHDLNTLLQNNRGNLEETLSHLEQTTNETSGLIADLRSTLTQFGSMLSANSSSIVEILENFQFASQNLEEFSRMVKERPWLLVRKDAPPKRDIP